MSFPSANLGYVLSFNDCSARTCAELRVTTDAGSTPVGGTQRTGLRL